MSCSVLRGSCVRSAVPSAAAAQEQPRSVRLASLRPSFRFGVESRRAQGLSLTLCRAEAKGAAKADVQVEDDWTKQYVEGEDDVYDDITPPEFKLRFLWLQKNIAVAVDQTFRDGNSSPLTEFFFWPRKDAWEELKAALEAKNWISERDTVLLLNRTTEVINFWQEEGEKHTLEEAREQFPDCEFLGA